MNILIRTDCSPAIGMGHFMRCAALALALKENGARVIFVMRDITAGSIEILKQAHCEYYLLPLMQEDSVETIKVIKELNCNLKWVIIDHYQLNIEWHKNIRPYTDKIMVIDDLADRVHDCDVLLNQNVGNKVHHHYKTLLPSHTQTLFGPSFALLRHEFSQFRELKKNRDGVIKQLFIFFGGGDCSQETMTALSACLKLNIKNIAIDVVASAACRNVDCIKQLCHQHTNTRFHYQISNMAEIMNEADLAIGAGGITNWERCSLGLPAIVLSIAENQEIVAQELAALGITKYLGKVTETSEHDIITAITELNNHPQTLLNMSSNAVKLVDGEGCKRVAMELLKSY